MCAPVIRLLLTLALLAGFLTAPPEVPLCDDRLRRGWYRFTNRAGGEMPTTCQETNRCGTTKPIWLDGTNPTASEGIVMRKICVNMNNSDPQAAVCCEYSEDIFMKNCGTYFVYYLYPTIDCDMAYCAGNIAPCPVGKWSPTDFPPCQDPFPVLKTPPTVTGPDTNMNKTFGFQCHVEFDEDNPDLRFEIAWTFNGILDSSIPIKLLSGKERTAFLDISFLKSHADTNIACQVQSYYLGRETYKSDAVKSDSTFFGMKIPPVITGPILPDNTSFTFQCSVNFSINNPYQMFEVIWTFDGQQDPTLPPQTVTGLNETAVLDGAHLKGHLNSQVGCEARLVYAQDVKTAFIRSSTYFAGLKISPNPLGMSEAEFEKNVTVTSTIPVVCESGQDCCVSIKLNFNQTSDVSLLDTCEHKMCSYDWDPQLKESSIKIGVVPTRNILVAGTRGIFLTFKVVVPPGADDYLKIFQDNSPERLEVIIRDESASQCSLTGDPHIKGFDSKLMYDLYKSGDFVAYSAPKRGIMVQVRTVPCAGGSVTCVCGVVVREKNDVIKVSNCNNLASGQATIDIAYKLSPSTIVQRSTDGYRFGIYLPSGSEVKIESGGQSVYISIPSFDRGLGRGICGTNDGVADNDFTYPDGRVTPPCTIRCLPDAFMESWRVTGNASLFEVVPDPMNASDPDYDTAGRYCSCMERPDGNSTVTCTTRQYPQVANTACPNCPVISDILVPSYVVGTGWVNPGATKPEEPFVHPEVKPVDTNKQWPNDQGITEAQAQDICMKTIQKSQLYPQCQNFQQITNSAISDCLSDILFGGSTAFLDDVTSAFTTQCQLKLAQNPDNYVTNVNGDSVLKPELLDHICPIECQKHGQCGEKGVCLCQDGWEGDTCLIESGKGPQLVGIKEGAFCDISQRTCDTVNIDITNINFMDQLLYSVQEVDEQGNGTAAPIVRTAVFLSPGTITCKSPAFARSVQRLNISASKNGTLFGNEVTVMIFDGVCLNCDNSGCREKNTACHINNTCYRNGEDDPDDGNRTCDSTRSISKWSKKRDPQDRFPKLETPPKLSGPVFNTNGSASFKCDVVYNHNDPEQVFEVIWTFNGQSDSSVQTQLLFGRERSTSLPIASLASHVDTSVGCQVRSYYVGFETDKSTFITSDTIYFGILTPPVLEGPIVLSNRTFIFRCEIGVSSNISSQEEIEVAWTFNGHQDPAIPSQVISSYNQSVELSGALLKDHLGSSVACQSRLVYSEDNFQTGFVSSNGYFFGIQMTPDPLQISEIHFEKNITLTSTVPILCDHDLDCCLTLRLNANITSGVSLLNSCEHRLCSSDWDPLLNRASIQIGVAPKRNTLMTSSRSIPLAFEIVRPLDSAQQAFQNYNPSSLQMIVKDETSFKCSLTGDPHIMGFDFQFMYDLYKSGDFIAYVAPGRDFMIQVRTIPCGAVACICGIAVREGNDVIKVTNCNSLGSGQATIDIAYPLSQETVIQRSTDGYRFGIFLPSGSEVRLESGAVNVYISIPAFDKGLGRGICGTNDGVESNDFTRPDGTVDPACTSRCLIPDAFLESWRVSQNESLFEAVPDPVNATDSMNGAPNQYCSCLDKPDGNSTVTCSARQYVQNTNTACPGCPVITNVLKPSYVVGIGWVRPGTNKPEEPFVHPEVKPVDPNKQWPNDQGVTEAQARNICTNAVEKSQLYTQCQKFQQITDSVVSDCLADILFGGTVAFLDDITSAYTTRCQRALAQNPDNYVTNADGDQILKPELLDHICPIECQKHGQCGEKGVCLCQDGWEGDTCMIESGKGPQLVAIRGGPLCDNTQRACDTVSIDFTNFNFMDGLYCQIKTIDEDGNIISTSIETSTVTPTTVTCQLPALVNDTQRCNISVTKDRILFSNELPIKIFDGTCLQCDQSVCREKNTGCHINNICYKNGDIDPNNGNRTCDVTKSTSKWTTIRDEQDHYPVIDTQPIVTGPIAGNNGSASFKCQVVYGLDDPEQVFEVVWVFNGYSDASISFVFLFGQQRNATLDIALLNNHVDKSVGCKVRAYYVGYETSKSRFIASNTVFFGVQTPPLLRGPILPDNKSFIFQCEVFYDVDDTDQEIEVVWTFDGQSDPAVPPQVISGSNRLVALEGLRLMGHLGTKIACKAALIYSGSDVRTTFIQSNTYFCGLQISPDPLEVSEIDFEGYINVASTIPIICGDNDLECCLSLKINSNKSSAVTLLNSCDYKICSSGNDSYIKTGSVQIGVVPTRNILLEGSKSLSLALELNTPTGSGSYMDLFQNYRPTPLQVTVKGKTAYTCSMTGDPHIYGFDIKQVYDLYNSGDYIAVVIEERDFMIQIRAVPCGAGSVSCICGIVVKEGNDVIKVSKCESSMPSVAIAYELSTGTVVQRSSDGFRLGVYLPSGSEVRIERGGTNIYISIPAFDKGLGRGLCGTNDGVADNDFTHPDGTVDPPYSQRLVPGAFFESWRVRGNNSLFEAVPDPVNRIDSVQGSSTQYCSCLDKPDGNSTVTCSARQYVQRTNTACSGCTVITDSLKPSYVVGVGWFRPGASKPDAPFVHPEVKPVDTDKQWPSDQGYTESQAIDICLKSIQKSQLFPSCRNFSSLTNSVLADCLADILYGGTTDFLDDITSSFTSQCQQALAQNPDNYVTNADGHQVLKPELLDHICPIECQKHGHCGEKGVCLCQDGWEGDTCLIESGAGPQITEINDKSLCDSKETFCGSIHFDVTNINFSDQLLCRFQYINEQNNSIIDSDVVIAEFLSPSTISCGLPGYGLSTRLFNISATINGTLFGNELPFRVFDSTCLSCDVSGCTEKNTACHINNFCYENGYINSADSNRTCDISKSTTQWTSRRNEQDRFPVLEAPPLITGPSYMMNGSLGFQCEVIYGLDDPDQVFEVVWTFNGQPDRFIAPVLLTGQDRNTTVSISSLRGHVDKNVGCQVRSYYVGYENDKSSFRASNTTFFGIETLPVLTGPIVHDNKSFSFQCEVVYESDDLVQEIEVVWTFNGIQEYTPVIINGSSRVVDLNGTLLMGNLDSRVGCQARLIYPDLDVRTNFVSSFTYFAGLQIIPNPLTMSEIDFEKYVTVTSTIPIICEDNDDDANCCLTFKINMNESSAVSLVDSCDYKMCSCDWDPIKKSASIQIGVVATRDVLVQANKVVSLAFDVITVEGVGSYLEVFENYRPEQIQITVRDEPSFKCSLTGDPHIMGFDFKFMYDLYKSGDFIAYVAPGRDFMIQVRTVPCGGGSVTCICGIVVREGNNVIKVTQCSRAFSGQTSVDIAYKLSPGTVVQRSTDGYRFGIYLPSGSEVKLESGGVNVYISIPAFDKGLGRGLCGTNDGIEDNDFTYPNGHVDPPCNQRCIPDAFLESWRVSGNESLFEVVPDPVNNTDPDYGSTTQYCSCMEKPNGNSTVTCSPRQHVQTTNTACSGCPVITDVLTPSYVVGLGWVRPGTNKPDDPFVPPKVKPVDPNKQWPNDQGVTEAQAMTICENAIQKSQLYSHCQSLQQLTSSVISDCLADILYGGTTDFLDDITSSFTSHCQLILAQNPDNYVTNADGDQVLKPELLDHICAIECQKHGQCGEKGVCLCQDGWEGDTCLIESGKGPQLIEIKGESSCDSTKSSCQSIHIDVANINSSARLQCRVQQKDENGSNIEAEVITTAVFLTPTVITCTLPPSVQSISSFSVSATKDGSLFGNELHYRVYNSTCLSCDTSGCRVKSDACHINNTCYKNGDTDVNDVNKVCDVTKSSSDWSLKQIEQTTVPGTTKPYYPTRPSKDETMRPCQLCFGG